MVPVSGKPEPAANHAIRVPDKYCRRKYPEHQHAKAERGHSQHPEDGPRDDRPENAPPERAGQPHIVRFEIRAGHIRLFHIADDDGNDGERPEGERCQRVQTVIDVYQSDMVIDVAAWALLSMVSGMLPSLSW